MLIFTTGRSRRGLLSSRLDYKMHKLMQRAYIVAVVTFLAFVYNFKISRKSRSDFPQLRLEVLGDIVNMASPVQSSIIVPDNLSSPTSFDVVYSSVPWMNLTLPGKRDISRYREITRSIRSKTLQTLCQVDKKKDFSNLTERDISTLYRQVIVDDDRRYLFCFVPKVACSNWKRVIKIMQGTMDPHGKMDHHSGMTFLQNTEASIAQLKIKYYYKFMFVRHPLERLLSAYRNKFGENIGDYRRKYGRKIIKAYRSKSQARKALLEGDLSITFEEFVRFLIDSDTAKMDVHWKPMHELCQPCAMKYDFVGSFEQLREDADFVLGKIRGNMSVTFPIRQTYYKPTTPDTLIAELSHVKPIYLQQLVDKYISDFALFGYSAPRVEI